VGDTNGQDSKASAQGRALSVITRLDRLARSTYHLAQIAHRLNEQGIGLQVLDQAIDRIHAEAHVEAMNDHGLPDLATKQDLEKLRHDIVWRVCGIVAGINGLMFARSKLT
jgi:hypothetical protein